MKKKFLLIAFALLTISTVQAQSVSLTVTERNGIAVDTATASFKLEQVRFVQKKASSSVVGYVDMNRPTQVTLNGVTESIDTIYNYLNKFGANFVKIYQVARVGSTARDTATQWLYPIKNISEPASYTESALPKASSRVYIKQLDNSYKKTIIDETAAGLNTRIDSLYQLASGKSKVAYDTSSYTMKSYDRHVVLNSTTADTLTLLNPSLLTENDEIVIANIGSGTYTLAGGFTVKDKSGSTVSSLTANTVYAFKAYYNGSGYIWLKEY